MDNNKTTQADSYTMLCLELCASIKGRQPIKEKTLAKFTAETMRNFRKAGSVESVLAEFPALEPLTAEAESYWHNEGAKETENERGVGYLQVYHSLRAAEFLTAGQEAPLPPLRFVTKRAKESVKNYSKEHGLLSLIFAVPCISQTILKIAFQLSPAEAEQRLTKLRKKKLVRSYSLENEQYFILTRKGIKVYRLLAQV